MCVQIALSGLEYPNTSANVLPLNYMSSLHLMTESSVSPYLNTFSMILILYLVLMHNSLSLFMIHYWGPTSFHLDVGHNLSFHSFLRDPKVGSNLGPPSLHI